MSQPLKPATNEDLGEGSQKGNVMASPMGYPSGESDFKAQKQIIDDLDLQTAISERTSARHDRKDTSIPPLLSFPTDPSQPLVNDWPFWSHEVHAALSVCGAEWHTIAVMIRRRSIMDTGRHPTICVSVSGNAENLEEAERLIEQACERNGHPLLNVEITRGGVWR